MNRFTLYIRLLGQQWKESSRNPMFEKKLLVNILMGLFFLYMFACLLLLGYVFDEILESLFDKPVLEGLNGLLLYTMIGGLFLRFFIQGLPLLNIVKYLHLPIKKGTLLHYVFLRTFSSVFNFIPLVFLTPFFFKAVVPAHPWSVTVAWLVLLMGILVLNNLLAFYLKKAFAKDPWFITGFGSLLLGLFVLNYYGLLDLMNISGALFDPLLNTPELVVIPVAVVGGTYFAVYRWAKGFLWLDAALGTKGEKVQGQTDLGLHRFGTVGRMAAFELDMIRRNKKPRTFALVAFLFLLYGLIFYPDPAYEGSYSMMIFVGVLTTGIFMMNFGQLHFAWDSGHFDKILTTRLPVRDYILSKYVVMVASCVVMFVLSLPYVYFDPVVAFVNLSAMLFNIGSGSMVLLFLAMYNRKGMSLSKSNMFNYEGIQMSQFLLVPFILGSPFLIYGIFYLFGHPLMGIGAIGGLGLLCLLMHPFLFPVLERMFQNRKHVIAEGFRSS